MLLQPGDELDEFTILDVLGEGGFSVVYKAEDTMLERMVAVKQLNADAFAEFGTEERFLREAKLAASLSHPSIVSIYTFKRRYGSLFLVMEYLDGGSVRDLISQEGFLSQGTVLKLASAVCHALDVLHQRGVIHRDIKPENILCTHNGDFKLADFGLAHISQIDRRRSSAGPQSGTLLYMSPEQAAGEELSPQSDIYSLGTVLFEALTGVYYLPQADEDEAIIGQIMDVEPQRPSECNPRVPDVFDEAILTALHKDPARRYESAGAFLDALRSAVRKKRQTDSAQLPPDLAAELYMIRTLRDLLDEKAQAAARLNMPWVRDFDAPEVLAEQGEMRLAIGDTSGYDLLEQAVARKSALPFAQIVLAEHYQGQGDKMRYIRSMIHAIEADPDLVFALYYERMLESIEEPAEYWGYVEMFGLAQPTALTYFNLGRVLTLARGYDGEAIAALQASIRLDSNYGPAFVALGSAWLARGDSAQAIPCFTQATALPFPQYAEGEWHKSPSAYHVSHAYLGLALAYAAEGRVEESADAALTVFEMAPAELDDHHSTLLTCYNETLSLWLDNNRVDEAYNLLTRLLPLAEQYGDAETLMLLGTAQAQIGMDLRERRSYHESVEWLDAAVQTLQGLTFAEDDPLRAILLARAGEAEKFLRLARKHR